MADAEVIQGSEKTELKQILNYRRFSTIWKKNRGQAVLLVIAGILLFLCFIPMILMIILSLKTTVQIYGNFWSMPSPIAWSNYAKAFNLLLGNMFNSTLLVLIAMGLTVFLSAMGGYVFSWLEFPGKKVLFIMILSLMMVPGILTLTPRYKLIVDLYLKDTWWALILPWVSGGQVFGILLCRTFMAELPASLFEAARIDGATEWQGFVKISVPLARPILTTVGIMQIIAFYNDFIWPLMVIDTNSKQVITVAIRVFQSVTGSNDIGSMIAGFVFTTLPLVVVFIFGSRYYIEGITSGAIKT
ncbi:MAG: hypothetical protein B6241_14840 [Spirochaetaceae bacterium 4572_59]|nr:MAG: hypothetical protein B6241_14840 [Spirochaetaceae bacterium 4572_59]